MTSLWSGEYAQEGRLVSGFGLGLEGGELEEAVAWMEVSLNGRMAKDCLSCGTRSLYANAVCQGQTGAIATQRFVRDGRYVTEVLQEADD